MYAEEQVERGSLGLLAAKLLRVSPIDRGSIDQIIAAVTASMLSKDIDGTSGLQLNDFELEWQIELAHLRAGTANQYLAMDLDGDLIISYPEMRIFASRAASQPVEVDRLLLPPSEQQKAAVFGSVISEWTRFDINKDGSLAGVEISALSSQTLPERNDEADFGPLFMAWSDLDADGTVSPNELSEFVAAVVNAGDRNGDGDLSNGEKNDLRNNLKELDPAKLPPVSRLPKSSSPDAIEVEASNEDNPPLTDCRVETALPNAALLAVGGYEGAGLSDMLMGDARDVGTVADGVIPEGTAPVHLLVYFSRPTILRLSGRVERIEAISSLGAATGFIGVARDQLTFLEDLSDRCRFEPSRHATDQMARLQILLTTAFDTTPMTLISEYTIGTADLGTARNTASNPLPGAIDPGYADAAGAIWRRMLLFNPGGFIDLDEASIISTDLIEPAAAWPGAAGVAKLLADGVISSQRFVNAATEVREIEPGVVRLGGRSISPGLGDRLIAFDGRDYMQEKPGVWIGRPRPEYIVNREFAFPPGMNTVTFSTFLVPKGVPVPSGDPGGSEVKYKEE